MSTQNRNLSDNKLDNYPDAKSWKIGILTAEWNPEVTHALRDAAVNLLHENGVMPKHINLQDVPGSFELIHGAKIMAETGKFDAVICFGCIIQGETRHFDFIAQGVTQGIVDLNIKYNIPFVFGVLTTNDQQQALDRAGGKHGNKGDEAAAAALKMIQLKHNV
ncbi:MAG: 6,7-dimethyl-8-ribityllumazine synthase [Bacteroidota bacterium]|nr:6,7-dimethyl-8-ribityllumazine synthase [Bacteroidota bacterium]